jgi:hypothetical protein
MRAEREWRSESFCVGVVGEESELGCSWSWWDDECEWIGGRRVERPRRRSIKSSKLYFQIKIKEMSISLESWACWA